MMLCRSYERGGLGVRWRSGGSLALGSRIDLRSRRGIWMRFPQRQSVAVDGDGCISWVALVGDYGASASRPMSTDAPGIQSGADTLPCRLEMCKRPSVN